jgi:endoglycosylceramidase
VRPVLRRLTLAAVVASLLLPGTAAAAPSQPLGHHGRWITDADGRVVILHGVAVVTGGFNTTYGAEAAGFGARDADLLAASGFNVVRLGFFGERLAPTPGGIDAEHLESFVRTHRLLAERGIFTLLDLHQDMLSPRYGGRGFADWFLRDDGLPNQPQAGFPGNYFANAALNRAYDNLWANVPAADGTGLQDHVGELWKRVAQRFRDEDHLLGYDLFNEPWPGSAWPTCASPAGCPPGGFDQTQLTAFFNRVIAALRTVDRRHLAFYEPNLQFDVGAATRVRRLDDPNVGMSYHDYCLGAAPGLPPVPDPVSACENVGEPLVMRNAEQHSAQTGAALLLTEFGDTENPAIHRRVADLADRFMVGWTDWAYMGSTGQIKVRNDAPPTPDNIRSERLAAVVRAYPPVIAGTPERFGYDAATKRFELRYRPTLLDGRRAGAAETEIAVPRPAYGRRYRVRVTGGEVVRGHGTPRFALRACPGASRVRVVVTDEPPGEPPARCSRRGRRAR